MSLWGYQYPSDQAGLVGDGDMSFLSPRAVAWDPMGRVAFGDLAGMPSSDAMLGRAGDGTGGPQDGYASGMGENAMPYVRGWLDGLANVVSAFNRNSYYLGNSSSQYVNNGQPVQLLATSPGYPNAMPGNGPGLPNVQQLVQWGIWLVVAIVAFQLVMKVL